MVQILLIAAVALPAVLALAVPTGFDLQSRATNAKPPAPSHTIYPGELRRIAEDQKYEADKIAKQNQILGHTLPAQDAAAMTAAQKAGGAAANKPKPATPKPKVVGFRRDLEARFHFEDDLELRDFELDDLE